MKLKALKVSQVNNYIRRILQSDPVLTNISVQGEISNIKYHGNGHIYFTLKDSNSKLSCFVANENTQFIKYPMDNGIEIVASGYIYVYEKNGNYALNVTDVRINGVGNLHIAFEKLKNKLEQEGLFSPLKKKKLSLFPKKIALLTSPTGAAIKDMITTIQNKNQIVDILVFPCLVQGTYAASDISAMIQLMNENFSDIDAIILGRGGGSMEELWPFNEEVVARAIYNSKITIVSAVGHETDFSISDFVADVRAATPTAAAELVAPDTNELLKYLASCYKDMDISIRNVLSEQKNMLEKHNLKVIASLFEHKMVSNRLLTRQLIKDISSEMFQILSIYKNSLNQYQSSLEDLNPRHIMKRGYAAVTTAKGGFIQSINQINKGDKVNIILSDGVASATVNLKERRKES